LGSADRTQLNEIIPPIGGGTIEPGSSLTAMHELFLEHFRSPRYRGELSPSDLRADAENPVCGDRLVLSARLLAGRLDEVRFLAHGCPAAIACGSAISALLTGLDLEAARALTRDQLIAAIGELPTESGHAATLALDVRDRLLKG
jgi:NifU-like protein involved in Fe-S cluster formation